MTEQTLRELARAHARGELGREAYREARNELIEGVLAGKVSLKKNEYPPPIEPGGFDDHQEATVPRPRKEESAVSEFNLDLDLNSNNGSSAGPARDLATPRAKPGSPMPRGILAGAVVIVLVIAGIFVFRSQAPSAPDVPTPAPADASAPPEQSAPAAEDRTGADQVDRFLQNNNWSTAAMQSFLAEWESLSPDQQSSARDSVEMGRLASAIYKKLLEERALSGLGEEEASQARQEELVNFARRIGIDDPRLTLSASPPSP